MYTIGNVRTTEFGVWHHFQQISGMSLGSVLLVEKNGVHRENQGRATHHCQTLSHNVGSPGRDSKS